MDDGQIDVVLGCEYGLAEETEVGHFGFVDDLLAAKFKNGVLDPFGVEFVHLLADFDAHAIQVLNFFFVVQHTHELVDFNSFGLGWEDGLLADLFSSHFVEVFGNASEAAQLRKDVGRSLAGSSFLLLLDLVLNPQQRLFGVLDLDIVLFRVVFPEIGDFFTDRHIHHVHKFNVQHPVEGGFPVSGHDYRINQGFLDLVSSLLLVVSLVSLHNAVYVLQDCVFPHDLSCSVHSQVYAVFAFLESRAVAFVHLQAVDVFSAG